MLRSSLPMVEIPEDEGWARSLVTVFHFFYLIDLAQEACNGIVLHSSWNM
jgi:hypothetical protein